MRLVIPTNLISIALDGSGHRELRYTHITADYGPGAFEIDPHYNAKTGVSTFTQALHRAQRLDREARPARHVRDVGAARRLPLPAVELHAQRGRAGRHGRRRRRAEPEGRLLHDRRRPGSRLSEPAGGDAHPDLELRATRRCRSAGPPGWGDQYDQTDAGQPISLVGVPDGTYILRATVDPQHVLREVTTANDVTDTTLTIAGNDVTVVSQKVTKVPLPRVRLTAGGLDLTATVSPPAGEDRPLGSVRPRRPPLSAPRRSRAVHATPSKPAPASTS